MAGSAVKTVIHVVGDNTWNPKFRFSGSTKDIVGRRDYFQARGIRCIEIAIKGRSDKECRKALVKADLEGVDAVLFEHPRFPYSLEYLKSTYPHIRRMVRSHNAELLHHLDVARAYLASGIGGRRWRIGKARQSVKDAWQRYRLDVACARLSDNILCISGWEAEHYWPRLSSKDRVSYVPYFLANDYAIEAVPFDEKQDQILCSMSAKWSPLAHHAGVVLGRILRHAADRDIAGWNFMLTGDLGPDPSGSSLQSGGRLHVAGLIPDPFEPMRTSRALAHLSNLGHGFKTKLLDYALCGGWILLPSKLYRRLPKELQPHCIVVSPVSAGGMRRALELAKRTPPSPAGINESLRQKAYAGLDQAFGYLPAPA